MYSLKSDDNNKDYDNQTDANGDNDDDDDDDDDYQDYSRETCQEQVKHQQIPSLPPSVLCGPDCYDVDHEDAKVAMEIKMPIDNGGDKDDDDHHHLDHKEDIEDGNGDDDDPGEIKNCRTIGVVQGGAQRKANLDGDNYHKY